jgi:hypothetical protein
MRTKAVPAEAKPRRDGRSEMPVVRDKALGPLPRVQRDGRAEAQARHEARDARHGERDARVPPLRRSGGRGSSSQKAVGRARSDDGRRTQPPLSSAQAAEQPEALTVVPAKSKGGRPRLLKDRPLTRAERSRRARAKPGAAQLTEHRRWKEGWDRLTDRQKSERVLQDICMSRAIHSDVDRVVAMKAVAAIGKDNAALYCKLVELLPPARSVAASPTHGVSAVKVKFLQMIENAVAADKQELARRAEAGETLSEREQLQLRLAQIDEQSVDADHDDLDRTSPAAAVDQVARLERLRSENAALRARLGEASHERHGVDHHDHRRDDHGSTPSESAPEMSSPVRRMTPADDVTINKRPTVIDVVPTLLDARAEPEPWTKRPAPEPSPAPQPTEPGKWNESENGKAFRQWYDAGKYDVIL